jgi:hypothetical protein
MNNDERITYFAETDARNRRVAFGIKAKDRLKHVYVVGKTGMGKSTLLENMAVQDLQNGEGMCFIDPHGKSADLLLEYVPKDRVNDVIYFAPFDTEYPISFNVMEDVGPDKRHLVVSGLMSTFKKIWLDAWSARMEYILTNTLLALLEYPDSTLMGINRMYSDKEYRKKVVDNITDPSVKSFWVDEYAKYTDRFAAEATPAIQNKIGQFTSNPIIRNIVGQPKSSFDIRKVMDEKKILIINLSKGRIGEVNANLLGSMLITKIYLAAMSRADTPERELQKLPSFYLFVDEFQSFANESFANILSEARKYKLNLTIAHQYIEQMSEEVRAAVLGNVGTMIVFRVGAYDAEVLEKEFSPTFLAPDLVNLGQRQIYLKLMINDVTSPPFSAGTLPPIKKQEVTHVDEIIAQSRLAFAKPRAIIEEQIRMLNGFQPRLPASQPKEAGSPVPAGGPLSQGMHVQNVQNQHGRQNDERRPERDRGERRPAEYHANHDTRQNPRQEERQNERHGERPGERYGERKETGQETRHEIRYEARPQKNPFADIKLEEREENVAAGQAMPAEPVMPLHANHADERDPLSLSSLVKQPQKKSLNNKAPSAENVNALRDVLSSILKKSGGSTSDASSASTHEKQKTGESGSEPAHKAEEKRNEPKNESEEPRHSGSSHDARGTQDTERKRASFTHSVEREVPEEVLKRVLSMEETK